MRDVYLKVKGAIAYVVVETCQGDESIGTAFHIGDGYFITAKHVLEGNTVREVSITQPLRRIEAIRGRHLNDDTRPRSLQMDGEPRLADGDVDVAVFRTIGALGLPAIRLSSWHDIDLLEDEVLLAPVICVGYPPIPLTTHPFQVAVEGTINALVRVRGSENLAYVISATSRGGFSGGPVLDARGEAIALVTESLVRNDQAVEAGFFTCLSISAAAQLALGFGWSPDEAVYYPDIESLATIKLALPETVRLNPHAHDINVVVYDDDRDVAISFECADPQAAARARAAFEEVCPLQGPWGDDRLIWTPNGNPDEQLLEAAARAARDALVGQGFRVVTQRFSGGWRRASFTD